jgi:hypothetical protein
LLAAAKIAADSWFVSSIVSLHDTHCLIDLTTVGVVVVPDEPVLAPEDAGLVGAVEAVVGALVPEDFVLVVEEAGVVVVPDGLLLVPDATPLVVGTFVVDVAVEALELLVVDAAADDGDAPSPQAPSDSMDTAKLITTATRFPIKINLPPTGTTKDAAS